MVCSAPGDMRHSLLVETLVGISCSRTTGPPTFGNGCTHDLTTGECRRLSVTMRRRRVRTDSLVCKSAASLTTRQPPLSVMRDDSTPKVSHSNRCLMWASSRFHPTLSLNSSTGCELFRHDTLRDPHGQSSFAGDPGVAAVSFRLSLSSAKRCNAACPRNRLRHHEHISRLV